MSLGLKGNDFVGSTKGPLKGKIAAECLKKLAEETAEKHEKFGDDKEDRKKGEVDYEEICSMKYESDVDSGSLFSSIGEHVFDSKNISTVTLTTSDDQSVSTKSSGSRHVSGAVFSEIMNPQGRFRINHE
ncbi:hypothetical protein Patl1_21684 [Pistacia atlantica]|uniref:Uncharacterized protein n=1 Tax=Pistacia atlantica TaxID=434234 RepID=A0ACC1BLA3_9ROSI|nr:hypothetical protein Patl1_21684 [Pistacia atlantica]